MGKITNLKSGVKYLVLLALLSLTCACSSFEESDCNIHTETIIDVELVQKLESYNDSVLKVNRTTRGGGRNGAIVMADIGGAAVGLYNGVNTGRWILGMTGGTGVHLVSLGILGWATLQSACSSYQVYKMLSEETTGDDRELLEDVRNNPLLKNELGVFYDKIKDKAEFNNNLSIDNDSVYIYMGELHNSIMTDLDDSIDPPIFAPLMSRGPIDNYEPIYDPHPISYEEEYEMNSYGISLFSDDVIESNNGLIGVESLCENEDYISYLNTLMSNHYISQNVNDVIRLLYELIMQSVNTNQQLNQSITTYKEYIDSSNVLNDMERQQLYLALEVARNSYMYWHRKGLI